MMDEIPGELIVLTSIVALSGLFLAWLCRADWSERGILAWWRPVEDAITQILMMAMIVTAALQVVARYALSDEISVPWTDEFSRLVMIWAALWGAVTVQRLDDHITMSMLCDLLPARAQLGIRIFGDLVVMLVLVPIVWLGWQNAASLQIMTTISLGLSLSIFAYSIPVTGALMVLHSLRILVWRLRGLPVGSTIEHAA